MLSIFLRQFSISSKVPLVDSAERKVLPSSEPGQNWAALPPLCLLRFLAKVLPPSAFALADQLRIWCRALA